MATALLVVGSTLTFWIPWQTSFASTSSYSSVVQRARLLVYLQAANLRFVPINAHVTWWHVAESWRLKRRQNVITALTTMPQGWVSARKHQCTAAITTMWTESLWAFSESYTADDSWIVHSSNGGQQGDKRAHNSTTKESFCTIIIHLCCCMIEIMRV